MLGFSSQARRHVEAKTGHLPSEQHWEASIQTIGIPNGMYIVKYNQFTTQPCAFHNMHIDIQHTTMLV